MAGFNFGPSPDVMRKMLPGMGNGMSQMAPIGAMSYAPPTMGNISNMPVQPPMGMGGGIDVGGGQIPKILGPQQPSPTNPNVGARPAVMPQSGMSLRDKMSTARPGFWGRYNSLAQSAAPMGKAMLGLDF